MTKLMETVVQVLPDHKPDKLIAQRNYVGQPLDRVDGVLKVTGGASFRPSTSWRIWLTRPWPTAPLRRAGLPGSTLRRRGRWPAWWPSSPTKMPPSCPGR
ncbi:MAG: hypothetical protein WKG07_02090 [Hymenobacter sp.]